MSPLEWERAEREKRKMYGNFDNDGNLIGGCMGDASPNDPKNLQELLARPTAFDPVKRPSHYNQHGIECIQAIEASMTKDEFQGYLKGNVEKYIWRYKYKNGLEDLKKAQWYLNKLIEVTEKA